MIFHRCGVEQTRTTTDQLKSKSETKQKHLIAHKKQKMSIIANETVISLFYIILQQTQLL